MISKINQAILSKTSPASNSTFTTGRNPKYQNQPTFPLFSLNQHIFIKGYAKNHLNNKNQVKKKTITKEIYKKGYPTNPLSIKPTSSTINQTTQISLQHQHQQQIYSKAYGNLTSKTSRRRMMLG